jgi:hypothetical protein
MLAWQTEQLEGRSVETTVSSEDGSRKTKGARHELEISTRNGKISGCILSKEGGGKPAPADCQMSSGKLIITIADEAGSGNAMELRMAPIRTSNYVGTLALISALLPGGRLEIGKATMTRIN